MAGTAGALVRLLGLLWLWRCALALATPGASHLNAHSLSFNITVTPKMQLWCKAEVQVDREPCFTYDCQSKQVMPVCVQGKKVEDSLMKELGKILEDLTGEFKKKFLDSEAKDVRGSSEPPSLQAMMVIQEEASGLSRGSWQFVINGRVSLHFNMVDRTWTVGDPGDAWMLQKWEDKYLNKFLSMMSNGDCKTWFNNVIANWAVPATTDLSSTALALASLFSSHLSVSGKQKFHLSVSPERTLSPSCGRCSSVPQETLHCQVRPHAQSLAQGGPQVSCLNSSL